MNNAILNVSIGIALALGTQAVSAKTQYRSTVQHEVRIEHARELLGKYYKSSVVRKGEKVAKINGRIYKWTREHLPLKSRREYKRVAQAIIDESLRYEMDPVFLLSVIQGESSFNPNMLGALDEIGLMQIRPGTADWICKKLGLRYSGAQALFDPVVNIRIGAAYMNYLRGRFDSHAQLYIAAYNMGVRNVANAQDKNIWPKDYPTHVMKVYVEFYSDIVADMSTAASKSNHPSKS
jgi:soluble lytic murein transglycosylase